ncbi:PIN domain containing protein [Amanita muscaria]
MHMYHSISPSRFCLYRHDRFLENMNTCLQTTLQRIDELINEDVQMSEASVNNITTIYIVLDTNILLHHFDVVVRFVSDFERLGLPATIVIPGVVIYELDGQKNRDGLAWFSRRASAWLLKKIRERKTVRGQANEETCKPSGSWKIRSPGEATHQAYSEMMNDGLILDCCLYFRRRRQTYLCSADKNLCTECEINGIHTISPTRQWDSRTFASMIWDARSIDLRKFGTYQVNYKDPNSGSIKLVRDGATRTDEEDEDSMMVDDDSSVPEILWPSHALDLLHIQVMEHFTRLLVELAGKAGAAELFNKRREGDDVAASLHAPSWQRTGKHYMDWSAGECLDYLWAKRPMRGTSPGLDVFLSLPYTTRGARRGQDWSRRDWEVGLEGLKELARGWGDGGIEDSLEVLQPHLRQIFAMRLRPTGI